MEGGEKYLLHKCSSSLAEMSQYLYTPVATYTHTANKEVVVSAVDVNTNTFTSVAHGLVNGNQIYPISNMGSGAIYPIDKYPGGLPTINYLGWYVVNKTDDTFQLSLTNGGAAIDITTNANMDLTKWHFEKPVDSINITNLLASRYLVRIRGRNLSPDMSLFVKVNNISQAAEWLSTVAGNSFVALALPLNGDISIRADIIIDYYSYLTISASGSVVKSGSASTNLSSAVNRTERNLNYRAGTITSLNLSNEYFANGTVVEVFRA